MPTNPHICLLIAFPPTRLPLQPTNPHSYLLSSYSIFMFFTLRLLQLPFFQHFFHVTKLLKLNFNLLEWVRNSKLLPFYYFGRGAWSSLFFIYLFFGCLQVGMSKLQATLFIIFATCVLKARSL